MPYKDVEQERLIKDAEDRVKKNHSIFDLDKIPPVAKILFILGLCLVIFLALGDTYTDVQRMAIIIIVALVLTFFFNPTNKEDTRLLEESEIAVIAYKQLLWKQRHPLGQYKQIPDGIIKVHKECKLVRSEWAGDPYYWEHGFSIISIDRTEEFYGSILNNPYTGACEGIAERIEGYSGREQPDFKYILSPELKKQIYLERLKAGIKKE